MQALAWPLKKRSKKSLRQHIPGRLHATQVCAVGRHRATRLDDLRIPPNNRLEALKRDRKGQHSIRINDQWRVCFVWTGSDAENVEIVDYH